MLCFRENLFPVISVHIVITIVIAGSTNSSQTGGYYSSNSSLGAQSSPNNRLSIPSHSVGSRGMVTLTKQSLSSEAANFEEEDDGFYDNILVSFRLV